MKKIFLIIIGIFVLTSAMLTHAQKIEKTIGGKVTLSSSGVDTLSRHAGVTGTKNLYSGYVFRSLYYVSIWSPTDTLKVHYGTSAVFTANDDVVLPGVPYCRGCINGINPLQNQEVYVEQYSGLTATYYPNVGGN
jgi:hypothetical protein